MKKLLLFILFVSSIASAQIGAVRVRADSVVSFHDSAFVFVRDSLRVLNYVELDSVKVPPCPPQGRINLLSRGTLGIYVQYSNCNRARLDSTWDSVRVAHIADSLRGFDSTKYKFRTDSVANSGYLPVHRLADSTASLRTDLKRKDDSTASTGWLPVHRLSDSTAVLRTDLKRKDDTTSGVGYVRNHQLSDSTSALRTDLKRKDDSTNATTGYTTLYQNSLKKDKTDSTASTGYLPVHRLPDSTAVLRTDLKRRDDSTASTGYLPVHRLADSTAVLRTDLKRKDDTTSGVGYVRNHQLNDSTSGLRTDLARQSTTITLNGTANQITSSAGAQDLSANRTWTFAIAGTYVGQSSITTLGTITTGVWHGTSIDTTYTEAKVKKLIAGTNITLSPSTGIGTVTVNASSNADSSRASSISDSTKAVAAANVKSPQNLTVGTSLSITSGTGTAATLLALGLNTIQGITTASTPQFARLGLGAAPDATALIYTTISANSFSNRWKIENTSNGASAGTGILFYNDAGNIGSINAYGSGYTTSGPNIANSMIIAGGGAGLDFDAYGASGAFRFYTGASELERMRIDASGNVGLGTTGPTQMFSVAEKFQVNSSGQVTAVNSQVANIGGGVGLEVATIDLINQGAAKASTKLYTPGAAGYYVVHWVATVTRAASTSSILGGAGGFQVTYLDNDDGNTKTMPGTIVAGIETNSTNSVSTGTISGSYTIYVGLGVDINYLMGYTSVGVTTMQYNLHIRLIEL